MREFFRGWKRKAGCVTCLLALGWVRSLWQYDRFGFSMSTIHHFFTLTSTEGFLVIEKPNGELQWPLLIPEWATGDDFPLHHLLGLRRVQRYGVLPTYEWLDGTGSISAVGYGWGVMPLTLLSAYLLVSKPRPAKPESEHNA